MLYEGPGGWAFRWEPSRKLERRRRTLLGLLGVDRAVVEGGEVTVGMQHARALIDIALDRSFFPDALVRAGSRRAKVVSEGEGCADSWVRAIRPHGDHRHWATESLILRYPSAPSGLVFGSDLDRTVLEVLAWGPEGGEALSRVLSHAVICIREDLRYSSAAGSRGTAGTERERRLASEGVRVRPSC